MHPPGLQERVPRLLQEWMEVLEDNPVDGSHRAFVSRLTSAGLLKVQPAAVLCSPEVCVSEHWCMP